MPLNDWMQPTDIAIYLGLGFSLWWSFLPFFRLIGVRRLENSQYFDDPDGCDGSEIVRQVTGKTRVMTAEVISGWSGLVQNMQLLESSRAQGIR